MGVLLGWMVMSGFSPSSPLMIHKFIYYLEPGVRQASKADWGHPSGAWMILSLSVYPDGSFIVEGPPRGATWIHGEHRGEGAALSESGIGFVALVTGLLRINALPFSLHREETEAREGESFAKT